MDGQTLGIPDIGQMRKQVEVVDKFLAGGLAAAVGARLADGFGLIADAVDLYDQIEQADLVVTGEGRLDATSFDGKVVGGVVDLARAAGVPVVAVVGQSAPDLTTDFPVLDLSAEFGEASAMSDAVSSVNAAIGRWLAGSA